MPNNKKKRRLKRAFTLVELLISVAIFAIVSLAVYSTFNSGATVLRRIKNIDFVQQKKLLKIQRLSRELREQPVYKKWLFVGEKTKINFSGKLDYFPSRLTYYFDKDTSSLMRVNDRLDKIITKDGQIDSKLISKPITFFPNVLELKFEYLYLDLTKNKYVWKEDWSQNILPLAVRFTIITKDQKYVSTVFLPTV